MGDNRSAILSSALHLFSQRGYEGSGVQEIVEAAGITKPTLYHYFGSKRGVLEALLESQLKGFVEDVQIAALYTGDLPLTLERVAQVYFRFARQKPEFTRLQLALWFTPADSEASQVSEPWQVKQYLILETLFVQAGKQHGNMRGRQRAYATTFLGMLNTYTGMALRGHCQLDEQLVYQAVHQFMHGILS